MVFIVSQSRSNGFKAPSQTITGFTGYNLPAPTYKLQQHLDKVGTNEDQYSSRAYLGWDPLTTDNDNYTNPVPASAATAVARSYSNIGNGTAASLTDFNTDLCGLIPSVPPCIGTLNCN